MGSVTERFAGMIFSSVRVGGWAVERGEEKEVEKVGRTKTYRLLSLFVGVFVFVSWCLFLLVVQGTF